MGVILPFCSCCHSSFMTYSSHFATKVSSENDVLIVAFSIFTKRHSALYSHLLYERWMGLRMKNCSEGTSFLKYVSNENTISTGNYDEVKDQPLL